MRGDEGRELGVLCCPEALAQVTWQATRSTDSHRHCALNSKNTKVAYQVCGVGAYKVNHVSGVNIASYPFNSYHYKSVRAIPILYLVLRFRVSS